MTTTQTHLLRNVCSNRHRTYDFLVAWIRNAVLGVDRRGGICLVLRGPSGCGKTFLVQRIIAPLFLDKCVRYETIGGLNTLVNGGRYRLLGVDDDGGDETALRRLVCSDSITYGGVSVPNRLHIAMTVGLDWKPPKGAESRFFVINMTNRRTDFKALTTVCRGVTLEDL